MSTIEELKETMNKFWEVESYKKTTYMNPEEDYCEKHFEETYSRQLDGRFIVKLPVKKDKAIKKFARSSSKKISIARAKIRKKPRVKKRIYKIHAGIRSARTYETSR